MLLFCFSKPSCITCGFSCWALWTPSVLTKSGVLAPISAFSSFWASSAGTFWLGSLVSTTALPGDSLFEAFLDSFVVYCYFFLFVNLFEMLKASIISCLWIYSEICLFWPLGGFWFLSNFVVTFWTKLPANDWFWASIWFWILASFFLYLTDYYGWVLSVAVTCVSATCSCCGGASTGATFSWYIFLLVFCF